MPNDPTAWAHQKGPKGTWVKHTPILVMMPDVRHWSGDLNAMRAFVAEFNDNHGFNGGHLSTIARDWFETGATGSLRQASPTPNVRTFAALEAAAAEWSERGIDPEPANQGEYLPRGIAWNTLRPGHEQYAGWEHWCTLTSDSAIEAGLAAVPDRPMMSEDRFRRRDGV